MSTGKALRLFLALVLIPPPAFGQGTPDLSRSGCGWSGGRWVCSFDTYLNTYGPNRPTGTEGGYASGNGGFCQHANGGTGHAYNFCGRTATGSGWKDPSGWGWGIAREAFAGGFGLPGQFNEARAAWETAKMSENRGYFRAHAQKLAETGAGLNNGHTRYSKDTIEPSTLSTIEKGLTLATQLAEKHLPPVVANVPEVEGTEPSNVVIPPMSAASEPLDDKAAALRKLEGDPKKLWAELEPLQFVLEEGAPELSPEDAQALANVRDRYFDTNGMVTAPVVGRDGAAFAREVGKKLKTSAQSPEGRQLRYQINRGTVAAVSAGDLPQRETALGAIATLLGADHAYAAGNPQQARELFKMGAETLDFTLGLIPVAGSINDAAQLVHGMATGFDFAGNPMTKADFMLRGTGILLGLLPAKAVLRLGGKVISRAFQEGCELIERMGLRNNLRKATQKAPELAQQTAEIAGHLLPRNDVLKLPGDVARRSTQEIIDFMSATREQWGPEGVSRVSEILQSAGIPKAQRREIVEHFTRQGVLKYGRPGRFANERLLSEHFGKHGPEFGSITIEEYQRRATKFFEGRIKPGVLEKRKASGEIVRYNTITDEFGVADADGTIKSFFIPKPGVHGLPTNLDYFHAQ